MGYSNLDIAKIKQLGGTYDAAKGLGYYKDGSTITGSTALDGVTYYAPTNSTISGLTDSFSPEEIGQMDFSKVGDGQLGTPKFDFSKAYTNNATRDNASVFSFGSGGNYYDKDTGQWMNKELIGSDKVVGLGDLNNAEYLAQGGSQEEFDALHPQGASTETSSQALGNYMQAGLGAVNMGLGIASYFDNKATQKKQLKLLDQQIKNNAENRADRKQYRETAKQVWAG